MPHTPAKKGSSLPSRSTYWFFRNRTSAWAIVSLHCGRFITCPSRHAPTERVDLSNSRFGEPRHSLDRRSQPSNVHCRRARSGSRPCNRSEEHTSELQSRVDLVCRLLLEKKKNRPIFSLFANTHNPNKFPDS